MQVEDVAPRTNNQIWECVFADKDRYGQGTGTTAPELSKRTLKIPDTSSRGLRLADLWQDTGVQP